LWASLKPSHYDRCGPPARISHHEFANLRFFWDSDFWHLGFRAAPSLEYPNYNHPKSVPLIRALRSISAVHDTIPENNLFLLHWRRSRHHRRPATHAAADAAADATDTAEAGSTDAAPHADSRATRAVDAGAAATDADADP